MSLQKCTIVCFISLLSHTVLSFELIKLSFRTSGVLPFLAYLLVSSSYPICNFRILWINFLAAAIYKLSSTSPNSIVRICFGSSLASFSLLHFSLTLFLSFLLIDLCVYCLPLLRLSLFLSHTRSSFWSQYYDFWRTLWSLCYVLYHWWNTFLLPCLLHTFYYLRYDLCIICVGRFAWILSMIFVLLIRIFVPLYGDYLILTLFICNVPAWHQK